MKKVIYILLVWCWSNMVQGQSEKINMKHVSQKFLGYFNENNNDSIVAMFSPEMKAALPLEKFTQVNAGLKSQLGSLKKSGSSEIKIQLLYTKRLLSMRFWP